MVVGPVRGVVFDLWSTLVPLPPDVRAAAFGRVCEALGVPAAELDADWRRTRRARETMALDHQLRLLGQEIGARWSDETVATAIAARCASFSVCFATPFADGRAAIRVLRERRIPIALVSNCSSEVRTALIESGMDAWFDAIVLSAEAGVMKPDPAIYALAAERLEPLELLSAD